MFERQLHVKQALIKLTHQQAQDVAHRELVKVDWMMRKLVFHPQLGYLTRLLCSHLDVYVARKLVLLMEVLQLRFQVVIKGIEGTSFRI